MPSPIVPDVAGTSATFSIAGRLDATNAPELTDQLSKLAGRGITTIVFEFSGLDYISSAGLRAMVFAKQKIGADVQVTVKHPKPAVSKVIRMTGFDSFLTIEE
jgi:anti-anti-sigma factor